MGIRLFNAFVKITGWPVQWICFRTKIYYEDKGAQNRRIKGPAILISNQTSVIDYAVYLFVFISRTLRFQMAELLFEKRFLGWLIKRLGGIRVDRNSHDFSCISKSLAILQRGGVVGVFPESRLPLNGEARPLSFKTGFAYLALASGVPIIPVYTNGRYFQKKRARVLIGTPVFAADLIDDKLPDKENIQRVTDEMRNRIIRLGETLREKSD